MKAKRKIETRLRKNGRFEKQQVATLILGIKWVSIFKKKNLVQDCTEKCQPVPESTWSTHVDLTSHKSS